MTPETLNLIRTANLYLAKFLGRIPGWLASEDGLPLAEIQSLTAAVDSAVGNVGRSMGAEFELSTPDEESRAQVNLYARNLKELRDFLLYLQRRAETRRAELRQNAVSLAEFQAWAEGMKLTLDTSESR